MLALKCHHQVETSKRGNTSLCSPSFFLNHPPFLSCNWSLWLKKSFRTRRKFPFHVRTAHWLILLTGRFLNSFQVIGTCLKTIDNPFLPLRSFWNPWWVQSHFHCCQIFKGLRASRIFSCQGPCRLTDKLIKCQTVPGAQSASRSFSGPLLSQFFCRRLSVHRADAGGLLIRAENWISVINIYASEPISQVKVCSAVPIFSECFQFISMQKTDEVLNAQH